MRQYSALTHSPLPESCSTATTLIVGVLTATDLLAENPMRLQQTHGMARRDIRVGDLMTPAGRVELLSLQEIGQMRVQPEEVASTFADIEAALVR